MNKDEFIKTYAVDRRNTNSAKWDNLKTQFGRDDLLPLWVADTEFRAPQAVTNALMNRVEQGAFGYTPVPESYYEAYINWQKKRYGISIQMDWMRSATGVVGSISTLVKLLTRKHDAVMVLQPVYYPFMKVVQNNHRKLVVSELINEDGNYRMDLEDIRQKVIDNQVKLLILCSPHNPVGRVWSEKELEDLLELCRQEQVRVISDEIHHDLIIGQRPFVSVLEIKDGLYRDNLVVLDAPSKTFNLAALQNSQLVIPNPQIRHNYDELAQRLNLNSGSPLGIIAGQAAYEHGDEWLESMLQVIKDNYDYLKTTLTSAFPNIKVSELEGTYLAWIDFSKVLPKDKVDELLLNKARLALDYGDWFGKSGLGFARVNLATIPENVKEACHRMLDVVNEYNAKKK